MACARGLMLAARGAEAAHRALKAERGAGQANRCAQLHHGLVEVAGMAGSSRRAASARIFARVPESSLQPRRRSSTRSTLPSMQARPLRSRCWRWRRWCSRRFRAKRAVPPLLGEVAVHLVHDNPRRPVQHARAPVVAKAAPVGQDLVFRCCGQVLKGGKAPQEAVVMVEHGRHPRLLQHDFGNPDGVRIVRTPPGQVAGVFDEPAQQSPAKLAGSGSGAHGFDFSEEHAQGNKNGPGASSQSRVLNCTTFSQLELIEALSR